MYIASLGSSWNVRAGFACINQANPALTFQHLCHSSLQELPTYWHCLIPCWCRSSYSSPPVKRKSLTERMMEMILSFCPLLPLFVLWGKGCLNEPGKSAHTILIVIEMVGGGSHIMEEFEKIWSFKFRSFLRAVNNFYRISKPKSIQTRISQVQNLVIFFSLSLVNTYIFRVVGHFWH